MSGSPFGIGEFLSADKQSDAAKHAANTAADAQMHGIDVMYEMWEKAQADFAPFLEAGGQGLATLTQSMPQYMNQVLAPLAQQIASFQYSQPLNPQFGQVNPVTGEVMQSNQMQLGQNQQIGGPGNFMDLNRNAPSIPDGQTQLAQQYSPAVPNQQGAPSIAAPQTQSAAPMLSAPTKPNEFLPGGGTIQMDYGARGEGGSPNEYPQPSIRPTDATIRTGLGCIPRTTGQGSHHNARTHTATTHSDGTADTYPNGWKPTVFTELSGWCNTGANATGRCSFPAYADPSWSD